MNDFVISSERAVIGRAADCDIMLESAYVSRAHAALEVRDDNAYLADLRSRNGVLVNGQRLSKEHRLRPGDEIAIGDCVLTYVEHVAGGESTQLFLGSQDAAQDEYIFVDAERWEVSVRGEPLARKLSLQEMTLLKLLFEHGGNVCTRETLGDAIWGAGQYDFNMLHRLVHRLKEKVESDPKNPRYIEAISGVGYKLRGANRPPEGRA